jgi:hypothetical protein
LYGTPSTTTSSPKLSLIACKSSCKSSRTASLLIASASASRSPNVAPGNAFRKASRIWLTASFTSGLARTSLRFNMARGSFVVGR